jgi:hypothetical protein
MAHRFKFVRAGGFDQVQITTGADLMALPELDQKLWVALACPTTGIEFDERTLELLDADKDKRIRAPELLAAVKWLGAVLRKTLTSWSMRERRPRSCRLDQRGTVEGELLLKTAKTILKTLGLKDTAAAPQRRGREQGQRRLRQRPLQRGRHARRGGVEGDALQTTFADVLACTTTPDKDKSGENGARRSHGPRPFSRRSRPTRSG